MFLYPVDRLKEIEQNILTMDTALKVYYLVPSITKDFVEMRLSRNKGMKEEYEKMIELDAGKLWLLHNHIKTLRLTLKTETDLKKRYLLWTDLAKTGKQMFDLKMKMHDEVW